MEQSWRAGVLHYCLSAKFKVAFKRNDKELKQALLAGLLVWLALEAASAWLGVWFNVGVDAAVAALFALPLLSRQPK